MSSRVRRHIQRNFAHKRDLNRPHSRPCPTSQGVRERMVAGLNQGEVGQEWEIPSRLPLEAARFASLQGDVANFIGQAGGSRDGNTFSYASRGSRTARALQPTKIFGGHTP
jgi:hypothetical protein